MPATLEVIPAFPTLVGRLRVPDASALNEELRTLILERASESRLADAATRAGMVPLREECLARVMEGETTLEEVVRLTQDRA